MPAFRKKPVVIEAMQWPGVSISDVGATLLFEEWFAGRGGVGRIVSQDLHVKTLEDGPNGEAKHVASPGDWIVRGVSGEFYPVKPDIFAATYDAVDADEPEVERDTDGGVAKAAAALQNRAVSDAWREYAGDFNSLTDEEILRETQKAEREVEEAEGWLEAVASWEMSGKPRSPNAA